MFVFTPKEISEILIQAPSRITADLPIEIRLQSDLQDTFSAEAMNPRGMYKALAELTIAGFKKERAEDHVQAFLQQVSQKYSGRSLKDYFTAFASGDGLREDASIDFSLHSYAGGFQLRGLSPSEMDAVLENTAQLYAQSLQRWNEENDAIDVVDSAANGLIVRPKRIWEILCQKPDRVTARAPIPYQFQGDVAEEDAQRYGLEFYEGTWAYKTEKASYMKSLAELNAVLTTSQIEVIEGLHKNAHKAAFQKEAERRKVNVGNLSDDAIDGMHDLEQVLAINWGYKMKGFPGNFFGAQFRKVFEAELLTTLKHLYKETPEAFKTGAEPRLVEYAYDPESSNVIHLLHPKA